MDINAISNKTILRILGLITLFAGTIYVAFLLHRQITWVIIALFFTLALNPVVEFVRRYMPKKSRVIASALVVFGSFAVGLAVIAAFIPSIVNQTTNLVNDFPETVKAVSESNNVIGNLMQRYDVVGYVQNNQDKLTSSLSNAGQPILDGLKSAASSLVALLTVISLTYFMLAEGAQWIDKLARSRYGGRLKEIEPVLADMYGAISGYVAGNMATSILAGVSATIILSILGVPYAIPLGIVVGLFDLLPLVGATLAAVVVLFFCLFQSIPTTIIMLIFFLIYQQLENQVIQPMVYSKTVQISPLVVFLSALIGASLAGLVGAVLAIPVAASIKIVLSYYLRSTRPATK